MIHIPNVHNILFHLLPYIRLYFISYPCVLFVFIQHGLGIYIIYIQHGTIVYNIIKSIFIVEQIYLIYLFTPPYIAL